MNTYDHPHEALDYALSIAEPGSAVEFGVAKGGSLRRIAKKMPVTGFDSFEGLPEDWRKGFGKGRFRCEVPEVPGAEIVVGLFSETLPKWTQPKDLSLIHIDCDLYSSTITALAHLHLTSGMVVVFDEYHGYPGHREHEARAWREYTKVHDICWEPLAFGPEQMVARVL